MDVLRKLEVSQQFVDWLLSFIANYDHRLQKEEAGHRSEKLSGDVPRVRWCAVLFSEVIFPAVMVILFVIAHMFVKSFTDVPGHLNASPLIRIAIVSLGPIMIVWNAAVLIVLFFTSLFLGLMLDTMCTRFGSVMAFIAHFLAVVRMVGFFEFLVSCHS